MARTFVPNLEVSTCPERLIVAMGMVPSAMITGIANQVAIAHETPASSRTSWPAMPKRSSWRSATPTTVDSAAQAMSCVRRSHAAASADRNVGSPPSARCIAAATTAPRKNVETRVEAKRASA